MAKPFDPWEKDPFFPAAEEVQESADRMESIYRQWIHERKFSSIPSSSLSQDLQTALGTAKWQLEELERAVVLNNKEFSVGEPTKSRRNQFISAIRNHIMAVEKSLKESNLDDRGKSLSWVQLNEGERNELALFLSGSEDDLMASDNQLTEVSVSSEDDNSRKFVPPGMLSFSGLSSSRYMSKMSSYVNGLRKWKAEREHDIEGSNPLLQDQQLNRRINACYEGSKSCLSSCEDENCRKQLDGWTGAFQRQLQRSQYHILYGRPIQMIAWFFLTVFLIVLIVLHSR